MHHIRPCAHHCPSVRGARGACTPWLPTHASVASMSTANGPGSPANSSQQVTAATVEQVENETPSVKHLLLSVDSKQPFSFKPGQWLDCFFPGVEQVGGYSICSTPAQLARQGTFEIAVKHSCHAPTQWVHHNAKPGSQVGVRVGGNFILHPSSLSGAPSLFVAGGIGITALASMVGHLVECSCAKPGSQHKQLPAVLLYSAPTRNEFALLRKLAQWQVQSAGMLDVQLFVTDPQREEQHIGAQQVHGEDRHLSTPHSGIKHQRIGKNDLQAALQQLQSHHALNPRTHHVSDGPEQPLQHAHPQTQAYVCGPPSMTDAVLLHLEQLGCRRDSVHSERWW